MDIEFERLKALGVEIVSPPTTRPWGAKNMSFLDPDKNLIIFRSFPKQLVGVAQNFVALIIFLKRNYKW